METRHTSTRQHFIRRENNKESKKDWVCDYYLPRVCPTLQQELGCERFIFIARHHERRDPSVT
jgi:hypothetical protein